MMQRLLIEVRGIVQGVGFRPHVHSVATALDLRGFVQNRGSHVLIDIEGEPPLLQRFVERITSAPPALASIEQIVCHAAATIHHDRFQIAPSRAAAAADVRIAPDTATCGACLKELFDPADRRFRYPFTMSRRTSA